MNLSRSSSVTVYVLPFSYLSRLLSVTVYLYPPTLLVLKSVNDRIKGKRTGKKTITDTRTLVSRTNSRDENPEIERVTGSIVKKTGDGSLRILSSI